MNVATSKFESDKQHRDPVAEVGTFRRFGPDGEVYKVVGVGKELADGDRMMRIVLPKTGEAVDYRLSRVYSDPREA